MPIDFTTLEQRSQRRRKALEEYASSIVAANEIMPLLATCIAAAKRCCEAYEALDNEALVSLPFGMKNDAAAVQRYMHTIKALLNAAEDRQGVLSAPSPAERFVALFELFKPAEPSAWMDNTGEQPKLIDGKTPVHDDLMIEAQLRSGHIQRREAGYFDWSLDPAQPNDGDIIRWRTAPAEPNTASMDDVLAEVAQTYNVVIKTDGKGRWWHQVGKQEN